jgi:hypothetical protein
MLLEPDTSGVVAVSGAPGLSILGSEIKGLTPSYKSLLGHPTLAFYQHELKSSARYGKVINDRAGESVLLVPDIEGRSVPGFDGVILDANGKPIANYSLKTLMGGRDIHSPLARAHTGVEKAERFAHIEEWGRMLSLFVRDQRGSFHISSHLPEKEEAFLTHWLTKTAKIFGIREASQPVRPTRIVIDITSKAPMPDPTDQQTISRWISESNGVIESVTFLKGDEVLDVR